MVLPRDLRLLESRIASGGIAEVLKSSNEFMIEHHQSTTQSQAVDDNASLATLPVCSGLVHSDYADLEENLRSLDF